MKEESLYLKEKEKVFTPLLAIEEASRCLLCHDAPCSKACPAGTNPAKFIRSLNFRNLKGAVATIRENNVLGGVCGRVCPTDKYCEDACSRCGIDKPIQIGKLQTYLTEYECSIDMHVLEKGESKNTKVAVIGSGPSGLAAAAKLAELGYEVTVFEGKERLGGWLTHGIPSNRLPKIVVQNEIKYIKDLGVEFKTNHKVGKDITIEEIKNQGFKAILIAIGKQKSKGIDINGKELNGVLNGTEFLEEVKINEGKVKIGKKVIVIGGGDIAMDCAATAKLVGAEDVKIVYRRTIEKMPADEKEIQYIGKLGIPIFTGFKPAEILGEYGQVTRFKAVGMFDDSEISLSCDNIIFAIGQEAEEISKIAPVDVEKGIIKTENYKTNIEGIFASGDIVEGEKTVVYAVKEGKEAALEIDKYLTKKEGAR